MNHHINTLLSHSVFYNNGDCILFKKKNDKSYITVEDCTSDVEIASNNLLKLNDFKQVRKPELLTLQDMLHTYLCDFHVPISL